ncbi:MAG: hypothetical protein WAT79_02525 [Saprospiraceae bacterium]
MEIQCREVESFNDIKRFIDFPHGLYRKDIQYVPEVYLGQKAMFDKTTYPFFEFGKTKYWLAYKQNKIVGRIAAIDNPRYNELHHSNVGFFGFFDCENDIHTANALLEMAKKYALQNGHQQLMGPVNYTTNETAGLLVDGFDSPPMVMMTYHPAYMKDLVNRLGFVKEMDLLAYYLIPSETNKKSITLAKELEFRLQSKGITIRKVNKETLEKDAENIKKVYNKAWEKNWGFIPFTEKEFLYLKDDLSKIMDPDFTYIAEKNGEVIGFSITIPNINEILIKNKNGRLFPYGIFRLLFGKKNIKTIRILALGVVQEYRKKGIEGIFFAKNIQTALQKNIIGAEASWILENNQEMNLALQNLKAKKYKTYRIFSKSIIQ